MEIREEGLKKDRALRGRQTFILTAVFRILTPVSSKKDFQWLGAAVFSAKKQSGHS
jgi:hypothetical protein